VRIISCSADACIRIWGTAQKVNFRKKKEKDEEKVKVKKGAGRLDPVLQGEMWGHSDSVNNLLAFTENSFASCSGDGTVALWKVRLIIVDKPYLCLGRTG
jgi:WD40 repeat protein